MYDDERKRGTPYADDSLRIDNQTTVEEVHGFMRGRVLEPIEYPEATIWNFSGHKVDHDALASIRSKLARDEYMIPYQVPAVWAYMFSLLPDEIQEAEVLVYSQRDGRYKAYTNFYRVSHPDQDEVFQLELEEMYDEHQG